MLIDFRGEESAGIDNFEVILHYSDKKIILSAGEIVAMPGPHFMVHRKKGSFIKYRQDVQERRLFGGTRPGKAEWGQDEENSFGTLYFVTDDGAVPEKVVTEIGNYGGLVINGRLFDRAFPFHLI